MLKKMIFLLTFIMATFANAYPISSGNQGVTKIHFKGSTFVYLPYYVTRQERYVFAHLMVSQYAPVPSMCLGPAMQIQNSEFKVTSPGYADSYTSGWYTWNGMSWSSDIRSSVAYLSNVGVSNVYAVAWLVDSPGTYNFISVYGTLVIYGNGCGATTHKVSGSIQVDYMNAQNLCTNTYCSDSVGWKFMTTTNITVPLTFTGSERY